MENLAPTRTVLFSPITTQRGVWCTYGRGAGTEGGVGKFVTKLNADATELRFFLSAVPLRAEGYITRSISYVFLSWLFFLGACSG